MKVRLCLFYIRSTVDNRGNTALFYVMMEWYISVEKIRDDARKIAIIREKIQNEMKIVN